MIPQIIHDAFPNNLVGQLEKYERFLSESKFDSAASVMSLFWSDFNKDLETYLYKNVDLVRADMYLSLRRWVGGWTILQVNNSPVGRKTQSIIDYQTPLQEKALREIEAFYGRVDKPKTSDILRP